MPARPLAPLPSWPRPDGLPSPACGSPPFGFEFKEETLKTGKRIKKRKKLIEVPEEQAVIRTIKACDKRGLGARRIAKQVANTHAGYENFKPNKVVKILNRKFQGVGT